MNKRIEKITLTRFRGATTTTEVAFDPRKPITFIFGENGSGKSSIVDAIDFVCNQAPGSLADRSSTRPKDHLPAIGHKAKDIKVELVCGGRAWNAKFSGAKISSSDEATLPVAHVLRRSRLLTLIDATPAERYKQLQKFIEVEGVEASEQSLRDAVRDQGRTLDEKTRARVEAEAELERFWMDEGRPGSPEQNSLDWAAAQSAADLGEIRARLDRLQNLIDRLDAAAQARDSLSRAETDASQKNAQVAEARRAADAAAGIGATEAMRLIELLRDARGYLDSTPVAPDGAACPVCEQPVVAEDLRRRIDERLTAMTALGELRDKLEAANRAHQNAVAIAERDRGRMLEAARSLAEAVGSADESIPAALPVDETGLRKLIENVLITRDALIARRDEAQKSINQFNSINQFYRRIIESEEELREAESLREGLERALEIVQRERIAFIQRVLAEVRDETNRLYALIHPDEPLGLDQLLLDENKKGSLLQICSFEGVSDVAPQAYFSESHLDTLGFCLWLAIAKLSSGGDAVVVLDDVFTSVDSVHFTRILDLLIDECENFNQVIITTHSRQWRDRYAAQQIPHDKTSFVELQSWTRGGGIRASRTRVNVEALFEHLEASPFDRQIVASKAGVLAESLFDWLTQIYECPLPRRRGGNYTLGDLCNGLKRLAKQLVIRRPTDADDTSAEEVSLLSLFNAITELTWIRDQVGAHFSLRGAEVSDADVKMFAQSVAKLATTLACPRCGGLAQKPKGTHFACGCARTMMMPLELV
ncbi:MAG TPA: AAA family ATPase [Blastocatellia bacterium]|nr:AAA family ATPase [Blastocatellia bacterium]